MITQTLVICSLLAVGIGFMIQQVVEHFINTFLVVLPFNIKTVA